MAKFRKFVIFVLSGVSLYYGGNVLALYLNQSSHIYHPEREWIATPGKIGLGYEEVSFRAADGVKLSGWYVKAIRERAVVLFCHGNAGNISHELGPIGVFTDLGLTFFLFDYRGYGKSEGTPSERGTTLDADAAWNFLVNEKKVSPKNIIICGRSFGAAVAIPLAVRHTPTALIAEAAFTSLADIASDMHPYFPVRWLVKYRYDSVRQLPKVHCPVLVVHSRDDQLVPYKHGQRLFKAANEPKKFLEITGPHNNKDDLHSQALYRKGLSAFIDGLLNTGN